MNPKLSSVATRCGGILFNLWILTIASFGIVYLAPGDPVLKLLRIDEVAVTQEEIAALREELGFNDNILIQYARYLGGLLQGDLGTSAITSKPVITELTQALPATFILSIVSLAVTILVVLFSGTVAALFRRRLPDKIIMAGCYLGSAMPTFWLALVLINLFAVKWGILPASGWKGGKGLWLPVICLVVAIAPPFIKIFRNRFVEISDMGFIRSARTRGVSERLIIAKHITRGSLIPVITMLAVSFGSLLSGSIVVEIVFSLPGVGMLTMDAITNRDYAVIRGVILLVGIAIVLIMQLSDLLCRLVDPSLRRQA
ncbi:putative oligopeptide transport system integral membrane protein [Corynebacterium kutscheri]|uniref:ABC-type dipeptide/oligopeptide/nickel transport system, permease component n=1 Tax=Corynebacterium kutscheri TaxID=35755 RepID=A0A0F6TD82_9CORY|nr:ABC transporter permease [Corynebacterium kutscheri]AKE41021.1 ABC-type dipeptide/oligopeptide/nickel transport system, permease component [Corynebacterium kutscheri]VEH06911.1 putative oligopeptide transport system integral membrane protein [Corynebacterium kutscheri]VEH09319.1 putative oligopeptide transport system integral membrane protein [Corynebacterium kutscheri]VEH79407.1 putative oligopeptide transport system integral membrane protein [Corynebacterium kutscheri]